MNTRRVLIGSLVLALVAMLAAPSAQAGERHRNKGCNSGCKHAGRKHGKKHGHWNGGYGSSGAWHAGYYDPAWGAPLALVVPPTAYMQTKWGWGVGNSQMTTIDHQFGRSYPGPFEGGGAGVVPTPPWPSHTDQFGVYYIRGPW